MTQALTAGSEPGTPALGTPALSAVPRRLLPGVESTSGGSACLRQRRCVGKRSKPQITLFTTSCFHSQGWCGWRSSHLRLPGQWVISLATSAYSL